MYICWVDYCPEMQARSNSYQTYFETMRKINCPQCVHLFFSQMSLWWRNHIQMADLSMAFLCYSSLAGEMDFKFIFESFLFVIEFT